MARHRAGLRLKGLTLHANRMRIVILAMLATLTPSIGQAQTDSSKSWPEDVGPGRIAWFDITTTDLAKSKEFYGRLFGWRFNPIQGTDLAVEIAAGDAAIGTLRGAEGPITFASTPLAPAGCGRPWSKWAAKAPRECR